MKYGIVNSQMVYNLTHAMYILSILVSIGAGNNNNNNNNGEAAESEGEAGSVYT